MTLTPTDQVYYDAETGQVNPAGHALLSRMNAMSKKTARATSEFYGEAAAEVALKNLTAVTKPIIARIEALEAGLGVKNAKTMSEEVYDSLKAAIAPSLTPEQRKILENADGEKNSEVYQKLKAAALETQNAP